MSVLSRNLFTNPSFEAGSGTVEVRRNFATVPTPQPAGNTAWSPNSGDYARTFDATGGRRAGTGAVKFTRNPTNPGPTLASAYAAGLVGWGAANLVPVAPGEAWTASAYAKADRAYTQSVQLSFYDSAFAILASRPVGLNVTGNANQWTRAFVTATVPDNAAYMGISVHGVHLQSGVSAGGEQVWFADALYEKVGVLQDFFDGSFSPDVDLTAAWTGAAYASAAILTGVPVVGVVASGCAAIRSKKWAKSGQYSLRLIPTSTATNVTYASLNLPPSTMAAGTALLTQRQEAPLAGALWAQRGRPYTVSPRTEPEQAPNAASETEMRWSWSGLASATFVLPHGGMAGSGDVWYDCLGLFEGVYVGPWFEGNTQAANGRRFYWEGAPNASSSVMFEVLGPRPDMAPVPRVAVDVVPSQFPADAVTVSLVREAEGRTFDVRGAQRLPIASPIVMDDVEAPFGVRSSYTVVGYDASGSRVGSLPVGSVTLDCRLTVVQQPLDARLSVAVRRLVTTAADITRSTPSERLTAQGRSLPGLVGLGRRSGIRDVALDLFVPTHADADRLQATLGGYVDDDQQLPIWLVRTPPGMRIPRVLFCHVPDLVEESINGHLGMEYVKLSAVVTEVRPPAAGITAAVLTYSDVRVFYPSYSAVGARYAAYSDIKRDSSLIGAANA